MSTEIGPMGAVWRAVLDFAGRPDAAERIQREGQNAYEARIVRAFMALTTTFEEIEHVLNLIARTLTFQEIRALLKLYVISWATLSDVVATMLNEVFDLGYAEQDVNFGAILRNQHVRATRVPIIVKKHAKSVRYEEYIKLRHDIVHRGAFVDPQFDELHGKWVETAVVRLMRPTSAEIKSQDTILNEVASESGIRDEMAALVEAKQRELNMHLMATRELLGELAVVLAAEIDRRRAA